MTGTGRAPSRHLARGTSLVLAIALLLGVTAVPALAAAFGAATITSGDLVSGRGAGVTVRIANTGAPASGLPLLGATGDGAIDAVQIEVPASVFTASSVVLPSGWTGEYDAEVGFVYATAPKASALRPGAAMDITIDGVARRVADDTGAPMPVFVSDDGGTTLTSAGTPTLTSRILEVLSVAVVKPAGATNADPLQVTAGQDTATVRVVAANRGSQPRTITLDAGRTGGAGTVTVTPRTSTTAVPTDGTFAANLPATFGTTTGALHIEGRATAGPSAARPAPVTGLAVQQAFSATYVDKSLRPTTVVQGRPYAFQLDVAKAGAQPATLATTFSISGIDYTVNASTSFVAGSATTTLTFPSRVVPDVASGEYATAARATGVDANGATVDAPIQPGTVVLDNVLPFVTLAADVGQSVVMGATPAAGNGRAIRFTGEVRTGGTDGGQGQPCGSCTVTDAVVVAQNAAGATLDTLPLTITNSNGTLSGNQAFTFPTGTTRAFARVTVAKVSGLPGEATSSTFEVDIVAPQLVSAVTGRGATGDHLDVFLSELVDATGVLASDFQVDDNVVTAIQPRPATNGATAIRLLLGRTLGNNATPTVSYVPTPVASARMKDRVALTVADKALKAIDGIVPEPPVIQQVQGLGPQDGEFWTNQGSPTVTVAGMTAGDVLFLYYDRNDNGLADAGEKVFEGAAQGSTQTVTLQTGLPGTDQRHALLARMFDTVQFGPADSEALNVDRTLPTIVSFQRVGNDVTVTFSEPLARGRDAAFDWTVTAVQDGVTASRTVTSVSGTGATRTLAVASESYDPARGAVTGVRFKFRGAPEQRYDDRATNRLADQTAG